MSDFSDSDEVMSVTSADDLSFHGDDFLANMRDDRRSVVSDDRDSVAGQNDFDADEIDDLGDEEINDDEVNQGFATLDSVEHQGYLIKKSKRMHRWKLSYCAFNAEDSTLYFFQSKEGYNITALAPEKMVLPSDAGGVRMEKKTRYIIRLNNPSRGKVMNLAAESALEVHHWFQAWRNGREANLFFDDVIRDELRQTHPEQLLGSSNLSFKIDSVPKENEEEQSSSMSLGNAFDLLGSINKSPQGLVDSHTREENEERYTKSPEPQAKPHHTPKETASAISHMDAESIRNLKGDDITAMFELMNPQRQKPDPKLTRQSSLERYKNETVLGTIPGRDNETVTVRRGKPDPLNLLLSPREREGVVTPRRQEQLRRQQERMEERRSSLEKSSEGGSMEEAAEEALQSMQDDITTPPQVQRNQRKSLVKAMGDKSLMDLLQQVNVGSASESEANRTSNESNLEVPSTDDETISVGSSTSHRSGTSSISRSSATKETRKVKKERDHAGFKRINEYKIISELGRGSYGKVKLAESVRGAKVAIKIVNKSLLKKKRIGRFGNAFQNVVREIAILKKLEHPNIVTLIEVIDDPESNKMYMVFEYIDGGNLMDVVGKVPEDKLRRYFRDIISGLDYLHQQQVLHGDIKPENLLITKDDTIKIADFGVSVIVESAGDKTGGGTPAFTAPEGAKPGGFVSWPADIWACGVTMYMLALGELPFSGATQLELYNSICDNEPSYTAPRKMVSPLFRDLLRRLLNKDPQKRLKIADAYGHAWITNEGRNPMSRKQSKMIEVSDADMSHALQEKLQDMTFIYSKIKVQMGSQVRKARERLAARKAAINAAKSADAGAATSASKKERTDGDPSSDTPSVKSAGSSDSMEEKPSGTLYPNDVHEGDKFEVVKVNPDGTMLVRYNGALHTFIPTGHSAGKLSVGSAEGRDSDDESTSSRNSDSKADKRRAILTRQRSHKAKTSEEKRKLLSILRQKKKKLQGASKKGEERAADEHSPHSVSPELDDEESTGKPPRHAQAPHVRVQSPEGEEIGSSGTEDAPEGGAARDGSERPPREFIRKAAAQTESSADGSGEATHEHKHDGDASSKESKKEELAKMAEKLAELKREQERKKSRHRAEHDNQH